MGDSWEGLRGSWAAFGPDASSSLPEATPEAPKRCPLGPLGASQVGPTESPQSHPGATPSSLPGDSLEPPRSHPKRYQNGGQAGPKFVQNEFSLGQNGANSCSKLGANRMACLKIKCPGSKFAVFSIYAPTSAYAYDVRQKFFEKLSVFYKSVSAHGPKYVLGDFNSRIFERQAGEERIIGDSYFRNAKPVSLSSTLNRFLLCEFCSSCELQIANTFFQQPVANQITYYDIGGQPMDDCNTGKFAQIDLILCPHSYENSLALGLRGL